MPRFQGLHILGGQIRLGHAAVVLERADGGNHHNAVGREAGQAALDVEELLRAEVGAEARFRDAVIAELQGQLRGAHGVAAVRNVGERTAVHNGRRVFQRLHKVRLDGVAAAGPPSRPPPADRARNTGRLS